MRLDHTPQSTAGGADLRAHALDALLATLDSHPDVAVVGPRLVDANGSPELSFGPMVSPLGQMQQKRRARGDVRALTSRTTHTDWVSGACLLVRRSEADAVGLLDERYFMYLEDVDFCAAIRARGQGVLFAAGVEVTHLRGRSWEGARGRMRAAYRESLVAFYRKHHPLLAPWLRLSLALMPRTS